MKSKRRFRNNRLNRSKKYFGGSRNDGDKLNNDNPNYETTEEEEIKLLRKCVMAGCRDGVSGKMESTVDGMPLETSMKCLRRIRAAALEAEC